MDAKNFASFLDCPICFSTYVKPVILSCGHTICTGCLQGMLRVEAGGGFPDFGDVFGPMAVALPPLPPPPPPNNPRPQPEVGAVQPHLGAVVPIMRQPFNANDMGGFANWRNRRRMPFPYAERAINCPECRQPTVVPEQGLPINFRLQDLAEGLAKSRQGMSTCALCLLPANASDLFDCKTCSRTENEASDQSQVDISALCIQEATQLLQRIRAVLGSDFNMPLPVPREPSPQQQQQQQQPDRDASAEGGLASSFMCAKCALLNHPGHNLQRASVGTEAERTMAILKLDEMRAEGTAMCQQLHRHADSANGYVSEMLKAMENMLTTYSNMCSLISAKETLQKSQLSHYLAAARKFKELLAKTEPHLERIHKSYAAEVGRVLSEQFLGPLATMCNEPESRPTTASNSQSSAVHPVEKKISRQILVPMRRMRGPQSWMNAGEEDDSDDNEMGNFIGPLLQSDADRQLAEVGRSFSAMKSKMERIGSSLESLSEAGNDAAGPSTSTAASTGRYNTRSQSNRATRSLVDDTLVEATAHPDV